MALFTDPPELTCGLEEIPNNSSPSGGLQQSYQIFPYGSSVFTCNIAMNDSGGASAVFPIILKRVAGTWTKPDATAWQTMYDTSSYIFWPEPACCVSGGKIHMVSGQDSLPAHLQYWTFDLATETYAASIDAPYFPASQPAGKTVIVALSDGRQFVAWGGVGSNTAGKFAFVSSGTFSAATVFEAAAVGLTINAWGVIVDASDTSHILYTKQASGVVSLWHIPVSSGGTVGTPDQVESSGATYRFGPGVMFGGKLTFTGAKIFSGNPNVYLFESDPTTISWAKKTVATRDGREFPEPGVPLYPCPCIVNSSLYIAWSEYDPSPSPYPASIAKIFHSIYDGSSFTAKDVMWDAGDNPYPGAGITPAGDYDVGFPSLQFSGNKLRLLGWSEFTDDFDESELYLEVALGGGLRRSRMY